MLDDGYSVLCASVDGMDVRIREPQNFDRKWYSHKFRAAALRYEKGISATSGEVVWVFGPFSSRQYNDRAIFNRKMQKYLLDYEKVLADRGYSGPRILHGSIANDKQDCYSQQLRAYHEEINGRLKTFSNFSEKWSHSIHKHYLCFFSAANVVQIGLRCRS